MLALWLNAFYGLLAILPVTGLCLLLGGLTGGEFWRMNLALVNTLFFSLAQGYASRRWGAIRSGSWVTRWALIIFFAAVLPALGRLGPPFGFLPPGPGCERISPYCPFRRLEPGYSGQPEKYWWALAASQLSRLAAAGAGERRAAASLAGAGAVGAGKGRVGFDSGAPKRQPPARAATRAIAAANPVLWLVGSEPGSRRLAWLIVWAWGAVVC